MNQCQLEVLKVITIKKKQCKYVFQKKMCCHGGTIGYSIRYLYWAVKSTNRLAEQTPCHTAESRSSVALIYFLSASTRATIREPSQITFALRGGQVVNKMLTYVYIHCCYLQACYRHVIGKNNVIGVNRYYYLYFCISLV